ncbi:MAG: tetratricopeptide repeat protein [Bacteriovoracaceae bacterium]
MKTLIVMTLLLIIGGCKTQEQIQREQMVDNLAVQIVEGQKMSADYTVRINDVQDKLNMLQGKIEESGHNKSLELEGKNKELQEKISIIEEQLKLIKEKQENQAKELTEIKVLQEKQNKYLQKVLKSLASKKKVKPKKRDVKDQYKDAMNLYRKGKYAASKNILIKLSQNKKVSGKTRAHVLHNLGMIAYMDKDFETAKTLFSKLFTEFPKSTFNKNGLLFLGKSFQKSKQKEQAKQVLEELIKLYPKAKQVKEAKLILKKI